jgi:hypothetical protein
MDASGIVAGAYLPDGMLQQFGSIQQLLISVLDGMDDVSRKLERLQDTVEKLRIEGQLHVAS